MRANRYLHIAVIGATLLFLVLWQTAEAGPPKKPGNPGLPGCLAKVSELNDIVANQQETIDQQAARIAELEDMLENFAAVPQTGQTASYATGDDGDLQMGVQWPDPRFTDNGDGTVTDHLTNLIWLKKANCFEPQYWESAVEASNNLANGECGLSDGSNQGDWHLPNIREIQSLFDYGNQEPALPSGHPFTGVTADFTYYSMYWTNTTDPGYAEGAYYVHMVAGVSNRYEKFEGTLMTWPVRGGN